jgi:hypothetical protein
MKSELVSDDFSEETANQLANMIRNNAVLRRAISHAVTADRLKTVAYEHIELALRQRFGSDTEMFFEHVVMTIKFMSQGNFNDEDLLEDLVLVTDELKAQRNAENPSDQET